MTKPSVEQQFALLAALGANVDWSQFTTDEVQLGIREARRAGSEFGRFMRNGFRLEASVLTPTTFGAEIAPPFADAELVADGLGDDTLDIETLQLLPVLHVEDRGSISFEEAVNRSAANSKTNWGQRAAFKVRDAGNAGRISLAVWPVGVYAVFGKTIWRDRDGLRYAWYVIRRGHGFYCYYFWFSSAVGSRSRLLSSGK